MALQSILDCGDNCLEVLTIYDRPFPTESGVRLARDVVYSFILFFPLVFLLGLLPQVNTFAHYLLEQIGKS